MSAEIAKPVTIPYESLINPEVSLLKEIEEAFGYAGIGLLLVTGVPGFEEARLNLLPLGSKLANIGNERLEKIVDAKSNYSVGWSHGKEMLRKGLYGMCFSFKETCISAIFTPKTPSRAHSTRTRNMIRPPTTRN